MNHLYIYSDDPIVLYVDISEAQIEGVMKLLNAPDIKDPIGLRNKCLLESIYQSDVPVDKIVQWKIVTFITWMKMRY